MIKDVRICAWGFLASFVCIFGGAALGGSFLMLPESVSAGDLAAHYRDHHTEILWFTVVQSVAALLWLLFAAAITAAIMRMQPRSPILALLALMTSLMQVLTPFFGAVFFAAAAVQPDASPEVILSLHITGKMSWLGSLHALVGGIVIAIAIFRDRSALLPKWYAWVNIVYAIFTQLNVATVFIKTGPFGPSGVVGMVLPVILVGVYIVTTTVALLRINPAQWAAADPWAEIIAQKSELRSECGTRADV